MKRKPAAPRPKQPSPATPAAAVTSTRHWPISLGLLAMLTLAMFGSVLFGGTSAVLSNAGTDLAGQFLDWRFFGFSELRKGNLALWNPHLFSGAPYFGGFQPALLYPLNALFLLLPLNAAINWTIALHVFLAGAFAYTWAIRRRLQPPAAFVTALMFMFGGPYFLHIYAGHLSNLCTMIWAPLLFLAIDGLAEEPSLRWALLGMFAVAMQVLAGHPQYVFYTGVAAALYCALVFWKAADRKWFLAGAAGIVLGGVALSAVQLFTGFQESHETVRSLGVPYEFAAMFSFPPEDFLTLIAPHFFGNMKTLPYWGRCYLWEMSVFVSVTGLVLGVVGIIQGERRARNVFVAMLALLILLALGSRTPLFKFLYACVPGFNQFRGNSKFIFLAVLFFAMLAGMGLNELLRGKRVPRPLAVSVGIASVIAFGFALMTLYSSGPSNESWWRSAMLVIRNSGESYLTPAAYEDRKFAALAASIAVRSLFIGSATLAIVALLLFSIRKFPRAIWALPVLTAVELFAFANRSLDTFDPATTEPADVKQYLYTHPGDYRILNLRGPNTALRSGAQEIWGYDPGVTLRYAQVVALSQNVPPDKATQYMPFSRDHPLLGMLRCRAIFPQREQNVPVFERTDYLPHILIVPRYQVLSGRDRIFSALSDPSFNPRNRVILESEPSPQPNASGESGTATVIDSSTDHLTIEATAPSGGVLLIADAYAKGWQARALEGSSQQQYQVMPANYCLRAIPLGAGKHRLRVEYRPAGFVIGRWVSWVALIVFAGLAGWEARRVLQSRRD